MLLDTCGEVAQARSPSPLVSLTEADLYFGLRKGSGPLRRNQVETAMPPRVCPRCHHTPGRLLECTSHMSYVYYYRCDECRHVWTHQKDDPNSPPTDVTVPAKKRHAPQTCPTSVVAAE
jgi:hypothetical protein